MKEEEIEKGDCGPPTRKVFFVILSDLNQAVPTVLQEIFVRNLISSLSSKEFFD